MLIDKLKKWDYYYYKLPLYIRNSYGMEEHFKVFYNLLIQLDNIEDNILYAFNVFDNESTYLSKISDGPEGYVSDILEKLGYLFGITRIFDVEYEESEVLVKKSLKLNNHELLTLLKSQIIKNNYKGTYEESVNYYKLINLPIYLLNSVNTAECYVYLNDNQVRSLTRSNYAITDNIKEMFKANLFTLQSMGIVYQSIITNIEFIAKWDYPKDPQVTGWDAGRWS